MNPFMRIKSRSFRVLLRKPDILAAIQKGFAIEPDGGKNRYFRFRRQRRDAHLRIAPSLSAPSRWSALRESARRAAAGSCARPDRTSPFLFSEGAKADHGAVERVRGIRIRGMHIRRMRASLDSYALSAIVVSRASSIQRTESLSDDAPGHVQARHFAMD